MKTIGLIFPHQLFERHPVLQQTNEVYIIEDSLFFGDKQYPLKFHKLKLAFHRASMKAYADLLQNKGVIVHYIEYNPKKMITDVFSEIDFEKAYVVDPTDYALEKRLQSFGDKIKFLPTPLFINSKEENAEYLQNRKTYFMHHFYQWQRKRLDILMDENQKPIGGKWSFDEDNRKKIPKKLYNQIPPDPVESENHYITEAKQYIELRFANNPGDLDWFVYPISHTDAEVWFEEFLQNRFINFGTYEDAITEQHTVLYHSLLSPLLNIGLLTPMYVVNRSLAFATEHNIAINNVEGFIRQIIGWREYMRMVYEAEGATMRNANAWNHSQKLSQKFYIGTTGIQPIDSTIQKVLNTAYCHHIERLMVLGNFMFLLETDPHDVYAWFMELFIDAYDWVMVPNVYAMTQNSARGLITTKPYISGANYILKMSDYKKGDWCDTWNALYWSFVITHKTFLKENGRMFFVTKRAEEYASNEEKMREISNTKNLFLETL